MKETKSYQQISFGTQKDLTESGSTKCQSPKANSNTKYNI